MAFHVPEVNHGLLEDVLDRFCVLLEKRAITGIDETRLDRWIANFRSDEEHYLAAYMLNRLIYRSQAIIDSSIDHLRNCLLPTYLRKIDHFPEPDIENFLEVLQLDDSDFPIRIVDVDGSCAFDTGKSGGVTFASTNGAPEYPDSLPAGLMRLVNFQELSGASFLSMTYWGRLLSSTNSQGTCPA